MSSRVVIGFIGYGAMASRMGSNLQKAGHSILAYTPSGKANNTHPIKLLPSPLAIAQKADVIIACVPDDKAIVDSLNGDRGLYSGLNKGQLFINTSTISPVLAQNINMKSQEIGSMYLDCPVSGSTPEADKGELIVLASGTTTALALAEPVLSIIGKTVIYTGPVGSAMVIKLIINGIMAAGLAAIAEGISYGLASGIAREVLYESLNRVAVISPHHKRKMEMALIYDHSPQFPTHLMQKDMTLLAEDAALNGVALTTIGSAAQIMSLARTHHKDDDYSSLINTIENIVISIRQSDNEKNTN